MLVEVLLLLLHMLLVAVRTSVLVGIVVARVLDVD